MNFEFYYFSDEAGKKRFENDTLRWCGSVTDPVSRNRFRPTEASARIDYDQVPFYFDSEATHQQFAARPDSFSVMHVRMRTPEEAATPRESSD